MEAFLSMERKTKAHQHRQRKAITRLDMGEPQLRVTG
jgi:hypothetical protein